MKVGDLVRYKNSEFVSTRVHETLIGLVLDVRLRPLGEDRTVLVEWNTKEQRFKQMWHDSSSLEVINESR